jgi:hypothetical protein
LFGHKTHKTHKTFFLGDGKQANRLLPSSEAVAEPHLFILEFCIVLSVL